MPLQHVVVGLKSSTLIVWAGTLLYDLVDDKVVAAAEGRLGTGRSPA